MFKKIFAIAAVLIATSSALVFATSGASANAETVKTQPFDKAALEATLKSKLGLNVEKIVKSPLDGFALVISDQGSFYSSYDGTFLVQGKIYQVSDTAVVDIAEASLSEIRLEGIAKFSNDMISYPAKDEKHVVTVFTDITCGYCRKMHAQMSEYNDLGITIRYLAYPRSGVRDRTGELSQGFKDLRSIWCHENPEEALTKAKAGSSVAQRICDKPIAEEFEFGRQIGVSGTPAIVMENGMMIPGYQPPEKLAEILATL